MTTADEYRRRIVAEQRRDGPGANVLNLPREVERRMCADFIRSLMICDQPPRYVEVVKPATTPVVSVEAWADVMTRPEHRAFCRSLGTVPVETSRVVDPLDPGLALVRWQLLDFPVGAFEDAA